MFKGLRRFRSRALSATAASTAALFEQYDEVVLSIEKGKTSDSVVQLAKHMFDSTESRCASIESRANICIGAAGIAASIASGLGAVVLQSKQLEFYQTAYLSIVALAALFFLRTVICGLRVHRGMLRHMIGPLDLVVPDGVDENSHIAGVFARYAIENFKINNQKIRFLSAAQGNLRNAVALFIVGGIVSTIATITS